MIISTKMVFCFVIYTSILWVDLANNFVPNGWLFKVKKVGKWVPLWCMIGV